MEKIRALLLLAIISLAATSNIVTSLGQEFGGYVYIKVVDAESKKPLPGISIEIEGEDGYLTSSFTNSSGVSRFWLSSDEFGVYTVRARDALGQELTLNITTVDITGPDRVFVLESTNSRFVNITVIDSLTWSAPPLCALLQSDEIPYIYWQACSLDGSINIVLREEASRVYVGSPLRKVVTIDIPSTGDFEKAISMEPTVSFNLKLTNSSEAKISILWSDVEYFDRYARVYGDPYGKTLIQYVVDLTLVKENGYSRKNVRLGTLAFERISGEKMWTYTVEEEWLNSTAICSITIDRDWLEKLSSSPYGYHYTWEFWIHNAYHKPFMDAVFPLYAQMLMQKYAEIKSEYDLLQSNYISLQEDYRTLESEFNELTANYTSLNENYQELQSNYASLQESYENLKGQIYLTYVFIATTVIFIATTIYFARKK